MRTSRVVSITLPPALLKTAEQLARKENRTMSELMREALRQYQRQREWEDIRAYGAAKAVELGIKSEDVVVQLIREARRERRTAGRNHRRKRA